MLITTEQAKKHLKINATLTESNFAPFIPDATQKYILPILGKELLALLETYAEIEEEEDSVLVTLYENVIPVISRFTFFIAAPFLDVNVGETGFTVSSNNNFAPASKERVDRHNNALEQLAWDSAETLLRFLEENKSDYPEWVASDAYTMQLRNLINSAVEFDKYVDIDKSRLTFQKLRYEIDNIEKIDVITLIGQDLFDSLMLKLKASYAVDYYEVNEFTEPETKLLNHLRAFIANKVAANVMGKDTQMVATFYLKEAKALINTYPDDFPDYRDSGLYDPETPDVPPFSEYDNTKQSSIFVA